MANNRMTGAIPGPLGPRVASFALSAETSNTVNHSEERLPTDGPQPSASDPSSPKPPTQPGDQRVIDAVELLDGQQEVMIRNGDQLYRLRKTRQGKLILHK